jgi:hypothetical protein
MTRELGFEPGRDLWFHSLDLGPLDQPAAMH